MLWTIGCVALVLGAGFVWGVPLTWALKGRTPLEEADWLLAPFVGIAALTVALHNLVYLDCPIGRTAPWVWLAGGGLGVWFLLSRISAPDGRAWAGVGTQFRASLPSLPKGVFLAALLAYGLNGLGLFLIGPRDYYARAHGDQENYTCLAQFLTDQPFSTDWDSLGQRPYLIDALVLKDDRIGAEVLQGFFAASIGTDAQPLFEPTILLGPALLVPAVYALARRLGQGRRPAVLAGLAAALLPGLTALHLNCYMSHTLSVAFVLVTLLALHDLAAAPSVSALLRAALLGAATVSLYAELTLILLGLAGVCLVGGLALRVGSLRRGLLFLAAWPVLTVGLNPLYGSRLAAIAGARATGATNVLVGGSWADYARALSSVWVADIWAGKPGWTGWCVFGLAAVLTLCAVRGLYHLAAANLTPGTEAGPTTGARRRTGLLVLAILALASVPLLVLAHDRNHPYQFQKLLLSISPLLVLGAAHGPASGPRGVRTALRRWGPLGTMLASGFVGTTSMALQTVDPAHPSPSSLQTAVLDEDYRSALHLLRSLRGRSLVLACGPGLFQNSWMAYSARHNDVWLVNPRVNNNHVLAATEAPLPAPPLRPLAQGRHLLDLQTVPADALLLTSDCCGTQIQLEGDCRVIWSNAQYRLWQLGPAPFVLCPTPVALRADSRPASP